MKLLNRKFPHKVILVLTVSFILLITPKITYALTANSAGVACPKESQTYIAILDSCLDFSTAVTAGIEISLYIGTSVAFIKMVIGAGEMLFAAGNPTKLENARTTIKDAALGSVLIAAAWVLFGYLSATLPAEWGINLIGIG